MSRVTFALLAGALWSSASMLSAAEVGYDFVRDLAIKRAAEPHHAPSEQLPPRLGELNYDEVRRIEFRRDRAFWSDEKLPFQLNFFPRGGLFKSEVMLHQIADGKEGPIRFDPQSYLVHEIKDLPVLPDNLGYAGFKILYPLNKPEAYDEVAAFLGASYFRCLGAGQAYGLSARGLALNAGIYGIGEEFPRFSEFWFVKPKPDAKAFTFYALLESQTVTGAFEFVLTPGKPTRVDTRATFVFRKTDELPGFAPLTSMFWYGENTGKPEKEKRPEVHDSDGLLVRESGGRAIWVPAQNPVGIRFNEIPVKGVEGFGLVQRDRRPAAYADTEAWYEKRPTVWIEPRGAWGAGTVRLAELPTKNEYADNLVAFWVPEQRPKPGKPYEISYRLNWTLDDPADDRLARVTATRQEPSQAGTARFAIDFSGGKASARDLALETKVVGGKAKIVRGDAKPYPETGDYRASFEVTEPQPDKYGFIDLECQLRSGKDTVSETWHYRWKP